MTPDAPRISLTDRLVAPGATRGEVALSFGVAFAGAAVATVLAVRASLPPLAVALIALVAFDLYGGAVVNATTSAKRWFHRPGRTARHHLLFVAVHVQPFLLAWAVPGVTWRAAATIYLITLAAALIIEFTPASLKRPAAFAAAALALALLPALPAALSWFGPLLLIKLLLAHLLPEDQANS
ncbi:MAG: hypothetical protein HOV86_08790 [Thermoactinospora sp.]|nr:hypothetical protein [Thermoactinospora sp.]